jgi:ubiquinone/menaquinone biosynthesis C-methylase UbiE
LATIAQNLELWDVSYPWTADGDEWSDQAEFCGQPYEAWKQALIRTFIDPHVGPAVRALEIAPGHGRWSRHLASKVESLTLVDVSPSCIAFCRNLLRAHGNVRFAVNGGSDLDCARDASVDFLWCYDAFVHIDPDVFEPYVEEIERVLRRGGVAVLHHAGLSDGLLLTKRLFLDRMGAEGKRLAQLYFARSSPGWRSLVSREMVARFAARAGLRVVEQTDSWGEERQFNCTKFGDCITTLRKP